MQNNFIVPAIQHDCRCNTSIVYEQAYIWDYVSCNRRLPLADLAARACNRFAQRIKRARNQIWIREEKDQKEKLEVEKENVQLVQPAPRSFHVKCQLFPGHGLEQ